MQKQPNLHHFDSLRLHLRTKMFEEVTRLEERIRELNQSDRMNKEILIETYRKVIDRKQSFLRQL